tara:strand:- start:249 stop:497 length:249 start_codon:yes stop_codon:yes gene_type:complete
MSEDQGYEHVYTGPDTNVQYLQEKFNEAGLSNRVRNDFDSGLRAGFGGGLPGQIQLFVLSSHLKEALEIAKSTFPKDFKDGE